MPTLMPNAAGLLSAENEDQSQQDEEDEQRHRISWRLRDAAQDLVEDRQALMLAVSVADVEAASAVAEIKSPLFSSQFDTHAAMARLTHDQGHLPHIFDLAAQTVLQAIARPTTEHQQQQAAFLATMEDDVKDASLRLPAALRHFRCLVHVQRVTSLERSHDNKEYTKRKGGRIDPEVQAAAAAAAAAKKQPAAAASKASRGSGGTKKQPRGAKSSSSTTAAAGGGGGRGAKKVKLKLPTSSRASGTSPTAGANAAAAAATKTTNTTSPTGASTTTTMTTTTAAATAPKFTRNTPASSAAALDFRFNSSRAILCAAGNLAMSRLTPGPALDVLNVPQNPAKHASNKQPQEGNNNNAATAADGSTPATSGEKPGAAATSPTTTTTTVNMGAVVVEAQTLGQRTISVVENSIRRAKLRYQYRRDNARYNYHDYNNTTIRNDDAMLFSNTDDDDDENNLHFLPVANPFDWNHRQAKAAAAAVEAAAAEPEEETGNNITTHDDPYSPPIMTTTSATSQTTTTTTSIPHNPNPAARTAHWETACLPRLCHILETGAGHAVYHDLDWSVRHGRLAHLLQTLARTTTTSNNNKNQQQGDRLDDPTATPNLGPHLIVTTQPEVARFTQEFYDLHGHLGLIIPPIHVQDSDDDDDDDQGKRQQVQLRALAYQGTKKQRRQLRQYFSQATGLAQAPFHVLVTSYKHFFQDYLHFCQLPWEVVVMDDGLGWMAAAQGENSNSSQLRHLWDTALFSANDQHIGLAASTLFHHHHHHNPEEWDFDLDFHTNDDISKHAERIVKDAWVGLTARHRIVTASSLTLPQQHHHRSSTTTLAHGSATATANSNNHNHHHHHSREIVYVSCLVSLLLPHFAAVVREEWDRSRIASDVASMNHFRHLVARSTVVHVGHHMVAAAADNNDAMQALVVDALAGNLSGAAGGGGSTAVDHHPHPYPPVPRIVPDEEFVSSGKVASSRRWTLAWLGPADRSWMRYELGTARFEPILDIMKLSNNHGSYCEEITTASSTTSSGASGQVAGTMAYRLAVRCGRHFGSEQGLRQHISVQHAPPGTWLCRTCSTDCATSQARTHHERSCGIVPANGGMDGDAGGVGGATPIVGQGGGPKSGVGKKKKGGRGGASQQGGATAPEEKDPDGSFRVPGYRGVWINTAGKHFVKIDGKRYVDNEVKGSNDILIFDSIDDAAKKYDEVAKKNKKGNRKLELNFKPDGSRIIYEDITPASTSGLGGSAANVVPALSVINIKDLPADVKPLLRDPRQTSRTGGNSKRHVYAYRGVCRQARKGHDRWQSQISFMGQNHYLGTFDSEWDAAAVYAWAHLILYGEEATRKAQKEGEEAAAAYEQEKRDIAAGKIPAPPAKPEKKKKAATKKADKKKGKDAEGGDGKDGEKSGPKKRKAKSDGQSGGSEKKPKMASEKKGKSHATTTAAKQKEAIAPILAKGVSKAPILSRREIFENVADDDLLKLASEKLRTARENGYTGSLISATSPADDLLRPCLPMKSGDDSRTMGMAVLLGISPASSGWDLQGFVEDSQLGSEHDTITALQLLAVEYDEDGVNEKFTSIMQGTVCVIGCADRKTQQAYQELGLGTVPLGGAVGKLDCHIGGVPNSCSEVSACIRYAPTAESDFQFACLANEDMVSLNGKRVTRDEGPVALHNGDICSVGARVFSFIVALEDS